MKPAVRLVAFVSWVRDLGLNFFPTLKTTWTMLNAVFVMQNICKSPWVHSSENIGVPKQLTLKKEQDGKMCVITWITSHRIPYAYHVKLNNDLNVYSLFCRRSPISIAAAIIYMLTQLTDSKKPLRGFCIYLLFGNLGNMFWIYVVLIWENHAIFLTLPMLYFLCYPRRLMLDLDLLNMLCKSWVSVLAPYLWFDWGCTCRYLNCNHSCRRDYQECIQGSLSPCCQNNTWMVSQG